MGDGKFFEIKSQLNGYALTIDDDHAAPGQRVNLQRSRGRDGQLWFEDDLCGRIRSFKDDSLVLEISDDHLIVNDYHMDEYNQKWKLAGDAIKNDEDPDTAFDVADYNQREGADVVCYRHHGDTNQQWEFEHAPPKYFYMKSLMNTKCVDIEEENPDEGAKIIMWDCHDDGSTNQLWWEDKWGNIRSKLNDFVFKANENGDELFMAEYDSENPEALWAKSGKRVYNKGNPDLCLDIINADNDEGTKLCRWDYEGKDNQEWDFQYVR